MPTSFPEMKKASVTAGGLFRSSSTQRTAFQCVGQSMKIRMGCWLLRQFFPKYTSFLTVTQEHLDHAIHLFNNRPWKCLNWETPYQALAEELLHLV